MLVNEKDNGKEEESKCLLSFYYVLDNFFNYICYNNYIGRLYYYFRFIKEDSEVWKY